MSTNPYQKMKENAIYTTPKEELTLMLYDGALKFANQAIAAIENKDLMKANDLIIKVQNIIREFQLTLDSKFEVSGYLSNMYDYMYRRLIDANMSKDIDILTEVRDLIREFRDTWKEAMHLAKAKAAK